MYCWLETCPTSYRGIFLWTGHICGFCTRAGIVRSGWTQSDTWNTQLLPLKANLVFGNCFLETDLGCYLAQPSRVPPNTQLELLPSPTGKNHICIVSSSSNSSTSVTHSPCVYDVWALYFDGSKMREGCGDCCVLIDPWQRKHLISIRLEFECTNNTVEYEALILGLQRAIDLNVVVLKAVGDLEIVIR